MADSARLQALKNLQQQLPVANQQVASGQAAARRMQVQSAVQKAPAATPIAPAAQQTAAAQAGQAGQQQQQSLASAAQQAGQVGQLANTQQVQEGQAQVQSLQQGAREQQMANIERLAKLDARAKKELYDEQMKFARDQNGRTIFNEQQLADYARMNANSNEDYMRKAQQAEQASARRLQMMETAYKKIEEDLKYRYAQAKQKGDQKTQMEIETARREAEAAMAREKNRKSNNAAAWQSGGQVVGAVVGGVVAGVYSGGAAAPAGAAAGGAVGGAAGGMIGSQM